MIELTADARKRFDEYLQRTRNALRGTRAVEPEEVEQNVIEHVELALAGVPAPVGPEPLRAVLEQLGPPERWLPEEEQPAWRRTMGRMMHGPEDWRLAYLAFGALVLMILLAPAGGLILFPVAFLLSRAYVQLMQERGEPLGARAWLVLPVIWMGVVFFFGAALVPGVAFPAVVASEQGMETLGFRDPADPAERLRMVSGLVLLSAGVWWTALSALFAWLLDPIRWLFAPTLARVRRGHLLRLTGIGILCVGTGAALLWA